MADKLADPYSLTPEQIHTLLAGGASFFPELEAARKDPAALRSSAATQEVLTQTEDLMKGIEQIPQTTYSKSSLFALTGDREQYETPYFLKRHRLMAAALRMFLGQTELKPIVQDYIWSICEETTWVLPAHSRRAIDLFSAETAYNLAETLVLLGDALDVDIHARVRREVEERIFQPYLTWYQEMGWYKAHMNWNGVCNSAVAATFLWLDPVPTRAARAVAIALDGLHTFVDTAFEADGTSSEGVGYWNYGLLNFIPLAEMLRAGSNGVIDLLTSERMRLIAGYPAKVQLSPGHFTCFADSHEESAFNPGNIARLAERTGERSLYNVIAGPAPTESDWRLTSTLRNILWWDGRRPKDIELGDAFLPSGAVARMVAKTPFGTPVVIVIKGGHNAVPHNNNDIGSFMVHIAGESLLTDPGAGLYTRQYFGPERYQNIFCNSYGHSVPRIGGELQPEGRQYEGTITVDTSDGEKRATVDFTRAYAVKNLQSARRQITLIAQGKDAGSIVLQDEFRFSDSPLPVEEAFVTWSEVEVNGPTAIIRGRHHTLRMTIEAPQGAAFAAEYLEKESRENKKPAILKRLTFLLPEAVTQQARVRMQVTQR